VCVCVCVCVCVWQLFFKPFRFLPLTFAACSGAACRWRLEVDLILHCCQSRPRTIL